MISKREVIKRHIDFAIRALFAEEDSLPIITVVSAAFQIARNLAEHEGVSQLHKTFKAMAAPGKEKEIWNAFNKTANFLKHADRAPEEMLVLNNEDLPETIILMTCWYYFELENTFSPSMSAFTKWLSLSTPELSKMYQIKDNLPPVQEFRMLSKQEKLKYGNYFLCNEKNA